MSALRQRGAMVEFPIKSDKQRLIVSGGANGRGKLKKFKGHSN